MDIPEVVREKARDFKEKDLQVYVEGVHSMLEKMEPYQKLKVSNLAKKENNSLFIECVKLFIRTSRYQGGIQFNSDFSCILKYEIF